MSFFVGFRPTGVIGGWRIFFELLMKQRRKKHGTRKRDWLTAIYIAACGQYIADHQHRCSGHLPWHGRLAQWLCRPRRN